MQALHTEYCLPKWWYIDRTSKSTRHKQIRRIHTLIECLGFNATESPPYMHAIKESNAIFRGSHAKRLYGNGKAHRSNITRKTSYTQLKPSSHKTYWWYIHDKKTFGNNFDLPLISIDRPYALALLEFCIEAFLYPQSRHSKLQNISEPKPTPRKPRTPVQLDLKKTQPELQIAGYMYASMCRI